MEWKTLEKYGKICEDENNWYLMKNAEDDILTDSDRIILNDLKILYQNKLGKKLIKYVYKNYPYYAINSGVAKSLLNESELKKINEFQPRNNQTGLYTIGYEGISFEQYLNKLIKYDIKVLCDVRKNAISKKYGFSKNQLKNACQSLDIIYEHFPELGIESALRRELNSQVDYDNLFVDYNKLVIPHTVETQNKIIALIKLHKRVAITCFESDICKCHRLHLANSIKELKEFIYKVFHI
jgi:uncharacterized protein (DUF488 family)